MTRKAFLGMLLAPFLARFVAKPRQPALSFLKYRSARMFMDPLQCRNTIDFISRELQQQINDIHNLAIDAHLRNEQFWLRPGR